MNTTFAVTLQEVDGSAAAGERRREEAAHQEAAQRLHVVHERGAAQSGRPVQSEGERHHQPDPGPEGQSARVCVCVCHRMFHIYDDKVLSLLHISKPIMCL